MIINIISALNSLHDSLFNQFDFPLSTVIYVTFTTLLKLLTIPAPSILSEDLAIFHTKKIRTIRWELAHPPKPHPSVLTTTPTLSSCPLVALDVLFLITSKAELHSYALHTVPSHHPQTLHSCMFFPLAVYPAAPSHLCPSHVLKHE